jgi:2-aminobenzoate-CoA ligase
MKDTYPRGAAVPDACLVASADQPEYIDAFADRIGPCANVGHFLSDLQVQAGRGDEPAAIHAESGRTYSFADLARESGKLAAGLIAQGIKPGDRVAYRLPNVPEALIVMIAAWKAGAVLAPTPFLAAPGDLRYLVDDGTPRLLFASLADQALDAASAALAGSSIERIYIVGEAAHGALPCWRELMSGREADFVAPETPSDSIAILWHTGGTTGRPKGCYHTHRRFLMGGFSIGQATAIRPGDRWAATAPIGHALGIIYDTIFTLLHGATIILIEQFSRPEIVLDAVARWRITTLTGLAVTWAKMLDVLKIDPARDVSSLRQCYAMWQSASSSDVYDQWKARNVELLNNFGSTSFATWILVPAPGRDSPRAALGIPAPGYRIAAVEVKNGVIHPVPAGEIGQMAVRGPTGLTYWNRPDLQKRDVVDGWTLSDDLIRFDAAGSVHYLGRTDYMISTMGYKIAPVEVEQVLSRHPAIREIAVVPAPCPIRYQKVVAYVALRGGAAATEALRAELRDLATSELPSHKRPQHIEFIDNLPRDALGKVQTRLVVDWAAKLDGAA